jgi:hypothetical protein
LGITFTVADNLSIMDGIEAVRSSFSKMYIDKRKCDPLIKSLESYRQEWDSKNGVYKPRPLHNIASHYSDALRYLCICLPKVQDGLSQQDIDNMHTKARTGHITPLNSPINNPFTNDPFRY